MVQHVAKPAAADPGVEEIRVGQIGGNCRCDRGRRAEVRRGFRVGAPRAKPGHRLGQQQPGNGVGDVVHLEYESLAAHGTVTQSRASTIAEIQRRYRFADTICAGSLKPDILSHQEREHHRLVDVAGPSTSSRYRRVGRVVSTGRSRNLCKAARAVWYRGSLGATARLYASV